MQENKTERERRSEARERLRRGRVLIVGAGGLGSAAGLALAEAGVGTIGLVDGDRVEVSNLQRQILHSVATIGRPKVDSAAAFLRRIAPRAEIRTYPHHLDAENLPCLFGDHDFAIDATDGVAAKFLVNDGAVATGTPYSHAGVVGWIGQTTTVLPGESACARCLFPGGESEGDDAPTCQVSGVIGSVVAAIGAVQASEAVKFLLGEGDLLANRLLTNDALACRWRTVPLYPNPRCRVCGARRAHGSPTAFADAP
jgi:molybdopterin/thiamine biosynthesis adenylyltransferase